MIAKFGEQVVDAKCWVGAEAQDTRRLSTAAARLRGGQRLETPRGEPVKLVPLAGIHERLGG